MKVTWTPIHIELGREGRVRLLKSVTYSFANGLVVNVPRDYGLDLASVPPVLSGLLPSKIKSGAGAVLHDRLYSHAEVVQDEVRALGGAFEGFRLTRRIADGLARYVWNQTPETAWADKIYWLGVRIGGGRTWSKHREARAREAEAGLR